MFNFKNRFAFQTASDYLGTPNRLHGCVQDFQNYSKLATYLQIPARNRFAFVNENFKKEAVEDQAMKLPDLVQEGDLLLYSNSGHGTFVPDMDGDEKDGMDEALYTNDGKLILDDDINFLLRQFVPGCLILGFFDNCHAGTMDRSLGDNFHYISSDVKAGAVLYMGCQEGKSSADAYIPGAGYNGAFSYFLLASLRQAGYSITYLDLLKETNAKLRANGYAQIVQMACSKGMENSLFGNM